MTRKMILRAAALVFVVPSLEAAIIHPLNNLKVIEIHISQDDLTRIAVQNDRIQAVFGGTGDYNLESDDAQGQVFIRPLKEGPITLTLITEGGHTQALRLVPKSIPSEPLILMKGVPSSTKRKSTQVPLHRAEVEDLLQACQNSRIPVGYREVPIDLQRSLHPYPLIREFRGPKLRALTFALAAPISELKFAKRCGIPRKDIIALLMSPNPQPGGHIYVIARSHP